MRNPNLACMLLLVLAPALQAAEPDAIDSCLRNAVTTADDAETVAALRENCRQQEAARPGARRDKAATALERRVAIEQATRDNPFVITPHRPNYLLLASFHADPLNEEPFRQEFGVSEVGFAEVESKFQISIKAPVFEKIFHRSDVLYVGYTLRAFWQIYETNGLSAPFREYNHEPEVWYAFQKDWEFLGLANTLIGFGINHQSNGRSGLLSRSWNRVFGQFVFEKAGFSAGLRVWDRINEDLDEDDNPDIEDFLGNFEFQGVFKRKGQTLGLMVRNNLDFGENRGAYQLDWSFPLTKRLRGYIQWFNGYGESLIDYNANVNAIGFGVQLTDWL